MSVDGERLKQSSPLPPLPKVAGFEFRRYKAPADLAPIAALETLCLTHDQLEAVSTMEELERRYQYLNHFQPQHDVVLGLREGTLVAALQLNWQQASSGALLFRHRAFVHPSWRRNGIGSAFFRYAHLHLRQTASGLPPAKQRYYDVGAADSQIDLLSLLKRFGYQPVRYFFEMRRPLDQPIAPLPLPAGLEARPAKPEHYRAIYEALDEAFQDHWGHIPLSESEYRWWTESSEFQPDLWMVAWDGDQVAGMVLNYIDEEENRQLGRRRGYTEDICVRRPWRRRGLARALLSRSLVKLQSLGLQEAALGVDTENPSGALSLYQDLGFRQHRRIAAYYKALSSIDRQKGPNSDAGQDAAPAAR